MPPDPVDLLVQLQADLFSHLLARLKIRNMTAAIKELRALEKELGRSLPEVQTQLERCFSVAPALPASAPSLLPQPSAEPETPAPRRGPGRPRKDQAKQAPSSTRSLTATTEQGDSDD